VGISETQKNLIGKPDIAYRWLSPFMPPELVNHLPIRAACPRGPHDFKAVAAALRALVRAKRKAKEPHPELLMSLYRVCLAAAFWPTLQHMDEYPARIAEYTALSDWESRVPGFVAMGYQNVLTLNKTDAKWLVAEFGEPQAHVIPSLLWPEIRTHAFSRYVWCNALERAKPNLSEVEQQTVVKDWLSQRLRTHLGITRDDQACFAASEARREYQRQSLHRMEDAWDAAAGDHVVADIETTGLSAAHDELLEVAAVKVDTDGNEVAYFSALLRVQTKVPGRITGLTGILQSDVDIKGQPLANVIGGFVDFIGNAPLFFHNAHFDERFLKKAAEQTGHTFGNSIYDTLPMAQIAWPDLESYRLATLAVHLGASVPTHRALADARTTVAVLHAARKAAGKVATSSAMQGISHENVVV
jgi:DNA polymerase-3 subunit epsilon